MRLQRDSYAPKSCAFDAANVQFLRAHLCKSHPVLQHLRLGGLQKKAARVCPCRRDHGPWPQKSGFFGSFSMCETVSGAFLRLTNQVKKTGTKIVAIKVAAIMPPKTPVPME